MNEVVTSYGVAAVVIVSALVLRLLLGPWLGDRQPFVTFYLAVFFLSWYGGRKLALFGLLVGTLGVAFFVLQPHGSLAVSGVEFQVGLLMFLFVSLGSIFFFEVVDKRRALEQEIEVRQAAERRLAEREEMLRITLASIGDAVITTDERGAITNLNATARNLTGWSLDEAGGRDLDQVFRIIHQHTRQPIRNPVHTVLEQGQPTGLENHTLLIGRDGTERVIDDNAAPIISGDGQRRGAVLIFRDVTSQRKLQQDLQQSQKLEAIGRLAGGIAHDFNNLLTVILGYTDLLLATSRTEPLQEPLREIRSAGEQAASLTRQLLAFGRKSILQPRVMDLNDVVRPCEKMLRRLIGENIEFVCELKPLLQPVYVDVNQITQVLTNLAINARDAMPEGGKLTINTEQVEYSPADCLKRAQLKPGRFVVLTVNDNGFGMSPSVQQYVFEPFFTTKEPGKGTGLGLATVHGIVEQSDGFILLDSAPGQGTTFRVHFPAMDEQPEEEPAGMPMRVGPGHETILLAEDEPSLRQMARQALEAEGYTVLEAENGLAALALARAHGGPIHLLVTDLVMPRMGGRVLAEQLRDLHPDVRVLYVTGYTPDEMERQAVARPDAALLQKPYTLKALTAKIRELLDPS